MLQKLWYCFVIHLFHHSSIQSNTKFYLWSLKCVSNPDIFSHSNGIALILLLAPSLQWNPGPAWIAMQDSTAKCPWIFWTGCQIIANLWLTIMALVNTMEIYKHYKLGLVFFSPHFLPPPIYQNITVLFCPICLPEWYQNSLPTKDGNVTAQWNRKSYFYKCKNLMEILVKAESDFNIFVSQNITDRYTEK